MRTAGKDIELKPCPFCGGEAQLRKMFETEHMKISCNHEEDCPLYGANLPYYHGEEQAAREWNRRTTLPNLLPTLDELHEINKYTRRPYRCEEVYTFSFVLCDNQVDRDYERFSVESLGALRELFLGKTCILDHERKSQNQTARIYHTELETLAGSTTQAGEPLTWLTARAYLPRTQGNRETIELIDSGTLKEVSVSCSVKRSVCSICGKESCQHVKGRTYSGRLCHRVLMEPMDAYECAFVVTPVPRKETRKKLKTTYSTPESCPRCMEHLSREWSFCPECGRLTDWSENAPLTLSELRRMDGEPVWIVGVSCINNFKGHWDICDWQHLDGNTPFFSYSGEGADPDLFGVTWLAYRHRPGEG